jgi:hypothetical protein
MQRKRRAGSTTAVSNGASQTKMTSGNVIGPSATGRKSELGLGVFVLRTQRGLTKTTRNGLPMNRKTASPFVPCPPCKNRAFNNDALQISKSWAKESAPWTLAKSSLRTPRHALRICSQSAEKTRPGTLPSWDVSLKELCSSVAPAAKSNQSSRASVSTGELSAPTTGGNSRRKQENVWSGKNTLGCSRLSAREAATPAKRLAESVEEFLSAVEVNFSILSQRGAIYDQKNKIK